jgi:serine/threonine-protein kinase
LAEEIINALAQIPGLKVIARTSAFAFRGKEQDIRKIAEALGVDTILEGSVRRAGSRVRITAQLITAADGSHLWSQRYDREMEDVFAVQDEVAAAIAGVLQTKLAQPHREAQPAVLRRHTPRLAAYEAYLKARHFQWQTTSESLALSREYFLQSIALDPEFAVARCAYADYLHLTAMVGDVPAREAMPLAREEARKALDLDPSLPEAHAILGVIAVSYDYDWSEAERRFRMAMAREPVPADVRAWYGYFFLMCGGRPQQAVEELERALHEDPLSSIFRSSLGTALCAAGRYDEAQAQLRLALQINPKHFAALHMLSLIHEFRGEQAEALALMEEAHSLVPRAPFCIGALAARLMRTGSSRAQALLALLGDGQAYGAPVGLCIFHLLCGEDEKAAEWLDKAIEQSHPLVLITLNGACKTLWRANQYLPALLRKVNLPETI